MSSYSRWLKQLHAGEAVDELTRTEAGVLWQLAHQDGLRVKLLRRGAWIRVEPDEITREDGRPA